MIVLTLTRREAEEVERALAMKILYEEGRRFAGAKTAGIAVSRRILGKLDRAAGRE